MASKFKTKILVIGLGGTGKKMLLELKRKLKRIGIRDTAKEPNVKLLAIDFDEFEASLAAQSDGHEEIVTLANEEKCYMNARRIKTRMQGMFDDKESREFYERWFPKPQTGKISYGMQMAGAAQWRPLGRVGFFEWSEAIHSTIREKFFELVEYDESLQDVYRDEDVVIYIASSLAGGTGSGTFLDTAYFVRQIAPHCPVYGLFLLANVFRRYDAERGRIYANTYGALKELNEFMINDRPFRVLYPGGEIVNFEKGNLPPFDSVFVYDSILGDTDRTSRPEIMAEMMADFVYVDMFLWQQQASTFTNIVEAHSKANLDQFSRKCVFNASGTVSIGFPQIEDLKQFLTYEYACKILTHELTQIRIEKHKYEELSFEMFLERVPADIGAIKINLRRMHEEIKRSMEEMRKVDVKWMDREIRDMAHAMYRIWGPWNEAKAIKADLDQWNQDLLAVDGNIEFKSGVNIPGEYRPFMEIMDAVKSFVLADIEDARKIAKDSIKREFIDHQLCNFIEFLLAHYKYEIRLSSELARRELESAAGVYNDVLKEIGEVIAKKPWNLAGMQKLVFESILIRYLRNGVKPLYNERIKQIRINKFIIRMLQDVLEVSKLNIREKAEALYDVMRRLKEEIDQRYKNYRTETAHRMVKGRDSKTQGIVYSDEYVDFLWRSAEKFFNRESIITRFEEFARMKFDIIDMTKREITSKLVDAAMAFSQDEVKSLADKHTLDPLEYVGDQRLTNLIAKAKNDYILEPILPNPASKNIVFVSIPEFSSRTAKNGDQVKRIKTIINNVFDAPVISDSYIPIRFSGSSHILPGALEEPQMVIKYITLYHPSSNIYNINLYYDYYLNYSKDVFNNVMFHLSKEFVDFPELVQDSKLREVTYLPQVVLCGNDGCNFDITKLARTTLYCPSCQRPIRTRCGNENCPSDTIHETEAANKRKPDKTCPVCKGELRTRWWFCGLHNEFLRTESNYCQYCVADHRRGLLPKEQIRAVEGIKQTIPCDGCIGSGIPENERYKITFADLYREIPEDRVQEADRLFHDKEKTIDGKCPVCRKRILPLCPLYDEKKGEQPHYVHRHKIKLDDQTEQNTFLCSYSEEHTTKEIFECGKCHLPITDNDNFCPRCNAKLKRTTADVKEKAKLSQRELEESQWTEDEVEQYKRARVRPVETESVADNGATRREIEKVAPTVPPKSSPRVVTTKDISPSDGANSEVNDVIAAKLGFSKEDLQTFMDDFKNVRGKV